MSALLIPPPKPEDVSKAKPLDLVPLLENGDRLSGAEFMRRYEAMPNVKAELIHGIVHIMASPVRNTLHAAPMSRLIGWLSLYQSRHPHLVAGTDGTVILADDEHFQPDAYLFDPSGLATVGEDDYVHGPPELVCEVAASTAGRDAHEKAEAYAATGVREYLLWRTEETVPQLDWFTLKDGLYHPMPADADDVITSGVFEGLRLNRRAMLEGDMAAVIATLTE
ncbi:MAG: Uma2 family endonuclease [Planctomycetota bacterium]